MAPLREVREELSAVFPVTAGRLGAGKEIKLGIDSRGGRFNW